MAEIQQAFTITAAEMQLLEWLRGTHTKRFSIVVDCFADGAAFHVKTNDFDREDGLSSGVGASFDAAWNSRLSISRPLVKKGPPFIVLDGGVDSDGS